jgi:PAS domain S-box-containing protein
MPASHLRHSAASRIRAFSNLLEVRHRLRHLIRFRLPRKFFYSSDVDFAAVIEVPCVRPKEIRNSQRCPRRSNHQGLLDRKELSAFAFQLTRMQMVVANARQPDFPIVHANDAFFDLTGYTADEVLGRNCRFLQGENNSRTTVAQTRAAIHEQREGDVEDPQLQTGRHIVLEPAPSEPNPRRQEVACASAHELFSLAKFGCRRGTSDCCNTL